MARRISIPLLVLLLSSPVVAQQASNLAGFHRAGQTFLTWDEVASPGARYRVYRHTQPITTGNLNQATLVADVDDQTSAYLNERAHPTPIQQNFIIQDLGPELLDTQGLFVWTAASSGSFYYAVTAVVNAVENTTVSSGNSTGPVAEVVADPKPVLVWQSPSGYGRIYTQFMDYADWNPTLDGYAYNYCVAVPNGYTGQQLAATIELTGYGNRYGQYTETPYAQPSVWIAIDDPSQTWYYGFVKGWDYAQGQPQSGVVRNYTEERILRSLYDAMRDPFCNVDPERIYAYGHSMGGSGCYNLGTRYPDVFAAIYADEGMTDYRAATNWLWDTEAKWGAVALNLPIANRGRFAGPIQQYDGTGVFDWLDHQQMMIARRGDEMAFIGCDHGSNDTTIDWLQEGRPWYAPIQQGRRAFAGEVTTGDHNWQNFVGLPPDWDFYAFAFRNHESIPAFSFSTGSSPPDPGPVGTTAVYNQTLEWSASWYPIAGNGAPVDTPNDYRIVLRAAGADETVDVTPRRLQSFVHAPGTQVAWRVETLSGAMLQNGVVVADPDGLITVPTVNVTAAGVRLILASSAPSGDDLILAPGPGDPNPPTVKGYTGSGAAIGPLSFQAYAVSKWGANVASGDIDGAASAEALTGPGPGSVFGPQVRAFDRASAPLAKVNYYAYGTLRYGVNVAGAALDADAPAEILTGAGPGPVFGPHVRGWNFDGSAISALKNLSFYAFSTLKYGVNVHADSVDADAFAEILAGAGPGAVFGAQVRGFDYDGGPLRAIGGINAFVFASYKYGLNVAGGDVDADGFDEIIGGPGPGPSNPAEVKLLDYDGSTLGNVPGGDVVVFPSTYGLFAGSGDVDADGTSEVLAGSGASPSFPGALAAYDYQGGTMTSIVALGFVPFAGLDYGIKVSGGDFGY